MKNTTSALGPVSLLLFGLAACGADAATPEDYDDIAVALSGLAAGEGGDVDAARDAAELAVGDQELSPEGEGRFVGERGQLSYRYDIDCFNARDVLLEACDVRTRRAEATVAIDGSVDTDRRSASLDRDGAWTLVVANDLSTVTIDGTVSSSVASSFQSLRRDTRQHFELLADGSYESIVVDLQSRQIVGGRIVLSVAAERMRTSNFSEAEASLDVEATIEFSPDGPPELTLDGDRSYEIIDQRPMPPEAR